MPKFAGTKDDDVADYLFSAKLYFELKNIKYSADSPQQRPLSLLVVNLKGPAAAWYREQGSFRANQGSFRCIAEDGGSSDEDDDYADNRDDHVEIIESLQLNMVAADDKSSSARELLRFEGTMNATKVKAERFDGTTTPARTAQQCLETINFAGRDFDGVSLIEWEVLTNQDVILGLPWLVQFNPRIDWQTGVMRFHKQRVVSDLRSANNSLEVSEPTVASVKLKPEFLQHPLPQNLLQQLNDYVKAGYFSMPLGPSSMTALGSQPLLRISDKDSDDDADASLCILSAAEFETNVKAKEYAELHHVKVKTSPKVKAVPLQLQAVLEEFADVFPAELPSGLPPNRSVEHEVLLEKNWIEVSDSPWVSNIFGVPKKDPATGKFPSRLEWLHSNNPHMPIRWVIDYRLVNAASDVAKIPLPHIEQLLDRMSVKLSALTSFMSVLTSVTSANLRLTFLATRSLLMVCTWTLARPEPSQNGQNLEPSKTSSAFWASLGTIVSLSTTFATLVLPLSSLVKKYVAWVWGERRRQAFNAIKLALQHAPVLRLSDFDKPFIVTTDASHACIGGVLSQLHDGNDVPVAFFSKKLGPHELNWPVHEKELFAIKQALTRWRHYLHGVSFDIYTDNSACKWFLQHPRLSGHLARWLDFFASFQFKLHHRPGALNVVADALSRPPEASSSLGEVLEDGEAQAATMAVCTTCLASPTCTSIRHAVSRRTKATEKLQSIPIRDQVVILAVSCRPGTSAGRPDQRKNQTSNAPTRHTSVLDLARRFISANKAIPSANAYLIRDQDTNNVSRTLRLFGLEALAF
ncbi:unnamed protein product [Phytophthora lilii]|uniref:Unnamed protein product n=1 Tax=Phytophthora lilii TaxID=2077276 RepID=A0A9W7DAB0_9STRA|nr:unnamed protein product [Phytophthora lilii]